MRRVRNASDSGVGCSRRLSVIALKPVVTEPNGLSLSYTKVSFVNWQGGDCIQFLDLFALQHTFVVDLVAHMATLTLWGINIAAKYQTMLRSIADAVLQFRSTVAPRNI
jgi:hypothetical protein